MLLCRTKHKPKIVLVLSKSPNFDLVIAGETDQSHIQHPGSDVREGENIEAALSSRLQ